MCIDFGARVPMVSIMRFIVNPDSTMSSTMITVRPERSSLMPITSLIVPVEVVPWYEASLTNDISQGMVSMRMRSAANMNDPFSTANSMGFLSAMSLFILSATALTRS